MQKWKTDKSLYDCPRNSLNQKQLDYTEYVKEFMSQDPVKDWESIKGCIKLWEFLCNKVDMYNITSVLDAGTKDGQFTDYLNKSGYEATGIEIDKQYVEYAQSKGRNVIQDNICDMNINDNTFDVVFSHHVFGLTPSYLKSYQECVRVVKSRGYVITLNAIPGNKLKHFSLINNIQEVNNILSMCPNHDIIYSGFRENVNNLTIILRKN